MVNGCSGNGCDGNGCDKRMVMAMAVVVVLLSLSHALDSFLFELLCTQMQVAPLSRM
jgi:hypothetical protein